MPRILHSPRLAHSLASRLFLPKSLSHSIAFALYFTCFVVVNVSIHAVVQMPRVALAKQNVCAMHAHEP